VLGDFESEITEEGGDRIKSEPLEDLELKEEHHKEEAQKEDPQKEEPEKIEPKGEKILILILNFGWIILKHNQKL